MSSKTFLVAFVFALTLRTAGAAQSRPSFEVASVRPSEGSELDGSWSPPGTGKFTAHGLSLQWLIVLAYGIDANQIFNKPTWLDTAHFDVVAKPSGNIALSREELRPLLQSLLQERFHLVTHTETRQMPGYALMVAKEGPKLEPTKGSKFPGYRVSVTDKQLNGLNWSMPYLATMLQHPAGRPVVDKTGISGSYDIKLDFASNVSTTDDGLPSVFTAIQKTLGLKLEPQNVPVEFLVIDHVDRSPTEN
jgi:uncharacterized protein (TIGR03435 family)